MKVILYPQCTRMIFIILCEVCRFCEVCLANDTKLLIVFFYRPPNSDTIYLSHPVQVFDEMKNSGIKNVLVLGDFNFPNIEWASSSLNSLDSSFIDCLQDMFWSQLNSVRALYANGGAVLDLLMTTTQEFVKSIVCVHDEFLSDHLLTMKSCLSIPIKRLKSVKRVVYNYKKIDMVELRNSIRNVPWDLRFEDNHLNYSFLHKD